MAYQAVELFICYNLGVFPSPSGDMAHHGNLHVYLLDGVFPSPGGDMVNPMSLYTNDGDKIVSVPWRGCGASVAPNVTAKFKLFPSPSGGMAHL